MKARILVQQTPDFALLETFLWTPRKGFFLLDSHLTRLADSVAYFSRTIDIEMIREVGGEMLLDFGAPYR